MARFTVDYVSENTTLRAEVAKQGELLHIRKNRTKGKCIALKGRSVFSTQEVLEVAKEAMETVLHKAML